MNVSISETCGASPMSLMAVKVSVALRRNNYDEAAAFLADKFTWTTPGSDYVITKDQLKKQMDTLEHPGITVDEVTIETAVSEGKFSAVTSSARASNGIIFYSHDLIEFSDADDAALVQKITSYTVDIK